MVVRRIRWLGNARKRPPRMNPFFVWRFRWQRLVLNYELA